MPRGDRTGPTGDGPMTGGRRGFCAGYDVAGFQNDRIGMGMGYGRSFSRKGIGGRMSFRNRRYSDLSNSEDANNPLVKEISGIKEMLASLMDKLSKSNKTE